MGKIKKRAGFTMIEVTIAIFILIVIIGSVLMLLSSSYASLRESEAKNIAKNIGTYTVEYIRSRNVTYDNPLTDIKVTDPINHRYDNSYPGLIDLRGLPLQSTGYPDDGITTLYTINEHPALPDWQYQTSSHPESAFAFYYSLQGYVSLNSSDPSDANVLKDLANNYYCVDLFSYNGVHTNNYLLVAFPDLTNPIKNFSAGSTYIPMIYTTDSNDPKLNPVNPEYDPHYTNDDKSKTLDYNGFRVLTSIAARAKEDESNLGHPLPHVQYFDVKVTVLWITGGDEHEYSLATQIVTY